MLRGLLGQVHHAYTPKRVSIPKELLLEYVKKKSKCQKMKLYL